VTMTGTAQWLVPPPMPRRSRAWRRALQVGAGASLLLATGGLGFLLARRPFWAHPAALPSATVGANAAALPPPAPSFAPPVLSENPRAMAPPERTRLMVETVPHTARVALDEALLPPDTRQVDMSKDYASHRVWAAAPGYRPKSQWVRFDAEAVSVKIVLDRRQPRSDGAKEALRRSIAAEPAGPGEAPPAEP